MSKFVVKNPTVKYLFFLISPFLSFLTSSTDAASRSSRIIFWLFGILFCWHMAPQVYNEYDDMVGMIYDFENDVVTWDYIKNQFDAIIHLRFDEQKEIYMILLNWFTHIFSDNYHLMFAFASIPYLYFMLGSLRFVTSNNNYKVGLSCIVVLALFVMPRDIITVQNPRFTTAFWMAIYCALSYFYKGHRNKYLVYSCLTPLIHSAFYLYLLILGGFYFAKRMDMKKMRIVWLCTIPFAFLSVSSFSNDILSRFVPVGLQMWVDAYLSAESFASMANPDGVGSGMLVFVRDVLCKGVYLFVSYKMLFGKKAEYSEPFLFFAYITACINMLQCIPELGNRMFFMQKVYVIFFWFTYYFEKDKYIVYALFLSNAGLIYERYIARTIHFVTDPDIFYSSLPFIVMDSFKFN